MIGSELGLWSGRASTSAGIEFTGNQVIVLGNSEAWAGNLAMGHAVMHESVDLDAVRQALASVGLRADGQLPGADRERIAAVLAKPSRRTPHAFGANGT